MTRRFVFLFRSTPNCSLWKADSPTLDAFEKRSGRANCKQSKTWRGATWVSWMLMSRALVCQDGAGPPYLSDRGQARQDAKSSLPVWGVPPGIFFRSTIGYFFEEYHQVTLSGVPKIPFWGVTPGILLKSTRTHLDLKHPPQHVHVHRDLFLRKWWKLVKK